VKKRCFLILLDSVHKHASSLMRDILVTVGCKIHMFKCGTKISDIGQDLQNLLQRVYFATFYCVNFLVGSLVLLCRPNFLHCKTVVNNR